MAKKLGIACLLLGIICFLGAIGFIFYNKWESQSAENASQAMLEDVLMIVDSAAAEEIAPAEDGETIEEEPAPLLMPTAPVMGYDCIGILSIPVLELELPVLTQWSYAKLEKAPCLYFGSYYEPNFVIAAHNFRSHFGRLNQLQAGDIVLFTTITGETYYYEVALLETLTANATEAMIASGFDLSLYTCTQGGGSRVTVRCSAISP